MKYSTNTVRGLPQGTTTQQVENNFNHSIDPESPCVAGPVVKDLQGNTCSTTVTLRNEKHGKKRSCDSLRKHFNHSHFRGYNSTISVQDSFYGLTPLAGEADAPIHICFVHGLGGHAFDTWSSDVRHENIKSLRAWPRDFLPKRLRDEDINARIYTLGYNANMMSAAAPDATINSAAEDLLGSLYGDRQANPPEEIYFVCHSLGGLIVCQALVMALFEDEGYLNKPEYRDLFLKDGECLVKGVVFMGTPFRGSGQAALFAPFIKAVRHLNVLSAVNDNFVRALNSNQPIEITQIVHRFQTIIENKAVKLVIACETRPVAGSALTTTYQSAITTFGPSALALRINSDHRGMTRFDDQSHADYKNLENHIIKMIRPLRPGSASNGETNMESQGAFSQSYRPLTASPGSSPDHGYSHSTQWQTVSPPGPSQAIYYNNYFGRGINQADEPGSQDRQHQPNDPFEMRSMYQELHGAHIDTTNRRPSRTQTFPPINLEVQHPSGLGANGQNANYHSKVHGSNGLNPTRSSTIPNGRGINDDDDPLNRLILFDTVFIIDDTGSMIKAAKDKEPEGEDRWSATAGALRHITQIAASKDPDGIDIRFLKAQSLNEDNITTSDTVMEIIGLIDMYDGTHGGGTVFKEHLENDISPRLDLYREYVQQEATYKADLRRLGKDRQARARLLKPKPPNKLNLIVVTDGQADDRQEVEDYIIETARTLDELGAPTAQVGIQFVQIGEDRTYLKRLDDDLKKRNPPIRDIVDTTRCDSDIAQGSNFQVVLEQVLLGAVTKDIDDRNT